ncbi:MAG: hypothetical protein LVQ64_06195, partial [Thermoplasmatales archaeon]|nr:hypothetical protein [Thermoplasmatales archaeon]
GSGALTIREGRHPVLDHLLGERFVPNDTELDRDASRLLVLTGPNMSGKSTYMRQIGLIVVLAQAGSFVPAKYARIGVVEGLFTRMGFTDEIGRGKSSFMVEMTEVAEILRSANDRSLVLLDEVGRGTSTFDGLAIAWATLRHLHDVTRCTASFPELRIAATGSTSRSLPACRWTSCGRPTVWSDASRPRGSRLPQEGRTHRAAALGTPRRS